MRRDKVPALGGHLFYLGDISKRRFREAGAWNRRCSGGQLFLAGAWKEGQADAALSVTKDVTPTNAAGPLAEIRKWLCFRHILL